jgi:hypothetical protein
MCGCVVCAACSAQRPRGKRVCDVCVQDSGGPALGLSGSNSTLVTRVHRPARGWPGAPRGGGGGSSGSGVQVPDFTAENSASRVIFSSC